MDPVVTNPFSTRSKPAPSPYDDSSVMTSGARGLVSDFQRADAAAAKVDPIAQQMTALTHRKTYLNQVKQAAEQLQQKFLDTTGADLFERDAHGKLMDDALNPGNPIPRLGAQIDSWREKSNEKVGLIRGALTPGIAAGDPTDEAKAAAAKLAEEEPVYKAKLDQWKRIKEQVDRVKAAHDDTELQLGQLAAQRLSRDGVDIFGTPAEVPQPAQQGSSVVERQAHNPKVVGSSPAPAPTPQGNTTAPTAAVQPPVAPTVTQPGAAPAPQSAGPTPLALVQMHKRMKDNESVIAMETTNPNLKKALQDKNARMEEQFLKGLALQTPISRQRVIDITRDPTLGEKVKNFAGKIAGGIGTTVLDTAESLARNAKYVPNLALPGITVFTPDFVRKQQADGDKVVKEFANAMRDEAAGWGLKGVPAEVAQKLNDSFASSVGQGIGSTIGFIGPTSIVGGVGKMAGLTDAAITKLMTATVAATGAASESNNFRREAEMHLQPLVDSGEMTKDEMDRALGVAEVFGAAVGSTEAFTGISRMAKRIGEGKAGRSFLRTLFDVAGKKGASGAAKWLKGPGSKAAVDVASEMLEESAQEFGQNTAENLYASLTFDKGREILPSASEAAGSAAVSTLIVSSLTQALGLPGQTRRYKALGEAVNKGAEDRRNGQNPGQNGTTAPTSPVQPTSGQSRPAETTKSNELLQKEGQGQGRQEVLNPGQESDNTPPAAPVVSQDGKVVNRWTFTDKDGQEQSVDATGLKDAISKLPEGYKPDLTKAPRQETIAAPADQATTHDLSGDQIDKEWTAFSPESQSLGIPRAEMPQVKAEHRGALTQFLKAKDITSTEEEVLPGTLKPTQAEFSQAKVDKARGFTGGDRAILVSQDGHVIDGHHQWMAKLTDEPNKPMRVIRLDAPIKDLLAAVKEFPSAETAGGATAAGKPAPAEFLGIEGEGTKKAFETYRLTEDIPGHVKGSSVSRKTLEDAGFNVPARPGATGKEVTVPPVPGPNGESNSLSNELRSGVARVVYESTEGANPENAKSLEDYEMNVSLLEEKLKRGKQLTAADMLNVGDGSVANASWLNSELKKSPENLVAALREAIDRKLKPTSQPAEQKPGPNIGVSKPQATAKPAGEPITQGPESGAGNASNPRSGAETPSAPAPVVARGQNSPASFTKAVTTAAKIKPADKAGRFLADFSKRLHKAAPKAFADMEVHVLTQEQWNAHKELGKGTPDSAGAYDQNTNTLYINSSKSSGDKVINTIVHEAGHFAEKFYLGEKFTQAEWEKLTPDKRVAAYQQYTRNAIISGASGDLTQNAKARAEWVAMQFARVVRGDTEGMSTGLKAKLEKMLSDIRELVNKWIGDGKLTTPALDAKILEMLGYAEQKSEKHRLVGKNSEGQNVYEDDRGARHVEQVPNILVSEPVGLVPTRAENGGIQYLPEIRTANQRKGTPFETVEERDAAKAPETPHKPEVAPQPQKKPARESASDQAKKLFDGLLGTPAEPIEQKGFPRERRDMASKLAETLIDDGVNTPKGLAEWLEKELGGKARQYSQALWNALGVVEPSLSSQPNWSAIYGEMDKPATQETEKPADNSEIRALITSEDNRQKKSAAITRMANERGITVKNMQELVEAELVKMLNEIAASPAVADNKFEQALKLYDKQPLFSARTSTSVGNQAYSTPAPLAIALRHMTGVNTGTAMYEPTAGTGMLMVGTDFSKSQANEINDVRREALKGLGIGTITENDATTYKPDSKFDVVHANPPFGSIDNVNFDGYGIKKLEHLISLKALEAMKDDGTAALILGANMNAGPTSKGAQWVFENYLYSRYHVVDNFEVSGDLYSHQGASWPVRILVISGRRATPLQGDLAPKEVDRLDSWDNVWSRANTVRRETESIRNSLGTNGATGSTSGAQEGTAPTQEQGGVSTGVSKPTPKTDRGGKPGRNSGRKPASGNESTGGGAVGTAPGTAQKSEDTAGANDQSGVGGEQSTQLEGSSGRDTGIEPGADERADGQSDGERTQSRVLPESVPVNDRQVTYVPRSDGTPFGTLTPKSVGSREHAALDRLIEKVGPLADFVSDRLNMPLDQVTKVLAADQIDGVALAIDQIESGGALVIGDETGIGKGRQAAAVIRYAIAQGKIPVFFTKDPKLFSDMFADLKDIGTTVKPLIFGDKEKASIKNSDSEIIIAAPNPQQQKKLIGAISSDGMEKHGYDVVFSTYSQINQRNDRQRFLEQLAKDNGVVVILDEAHEASGDGDSSMQAAFMRGGSIERGKGSNKETVNVPGLLQQTGTKKDNGGVLYLSATYAKRPDNTPLYFRTAMGRAAQSMAQLVKAMESGGVALQQAVSEALAAGGQYLRRERDFSGVRYNQIEVGTENKEQIVRQVDDTTSILRSIVDFSGIAKPLVGEAAGGKGTAMSEAQIDVTEFAAVVHNQISQLLLAAKADAVIAKAVELHKAGEKPVITLMNTMESFLSHFVSDNNIKVGDNITLTWRDLLKHALSRSLRATIKQPNGDTEIITVTPEEIGMQDQYNRIIEAINDLDMEFPVSPIDYIVQGLRRAGINIGELTGRESGIEYTNPGKGEGVYKTFKKADKNALVNGFNGGTLDALLLNASGSTGLSIHASTRYKDQKKRHMLIAQAALDINVFMQTLGRIRRTGMVPNSAEYSHMKLPLQAEIRPAVITNRKMRSLNANTTADAEGSVSVDSADILNKYGDQVVAEYLDSDQELQMLLGLEVDKDPETGSVSAKPDLAKKFTGRLSLLPDSKQKEIYNQVIPAYNSAIEQLKQTGEYDLDIVVHEDWDGTLFSDDQLKAGTDESSIFTASVRAQQWEITDNRPIPTGEDMLAEFAKNHTSKESFNEEWRTFQGAVNTQIANDLAAAAKDLAEADAMPDGKSKEMKQRKALSDEAFANQQKVRWETTQSTLSRIFDQAGQPIELSTTGDNAQNWNGMLVGVKFPDVKQGERIRFASSRFHLRYLMDEPGGRHYLTGAAFVSGKFIQSRSRNRVSDFTGSKDVSNRYKRWVITGNPIAGYEATGGGGKMVRFRARDGQVITGLLMRQNWDVGKLASDPRFLLSNGKAVHSFLTNQPQWGAKLGVHTGAAGTVRLEPAKGYYDSGYQLIVPSSAKGKDYFLDPELMGILGDFYKTGSRMKVTVPADQIAKVADRVAQIAQKEFRADGSGADTIKKVAEANKAAGPAKRMPKNNTQAPNTGPLGTPAVSKTETTEFKSWFRRSAVKDENGNPAVVYHGTPTAWGLGDFTEFDAQAARKKFNRPPGMDQVGSWFSSKPGRDGAERYSGSRAESHPAIYPVFLSIQRPFLMSFPEFLELGQKVGGWKKGDPAGRFDGVKVREYLQERGWDGILFEENNIDGGNHDVWVAFEPNQIKSAIGNKGTFDSSNPSILGTPAVHGTDEQEKIINKVTGTLEDKRTFKEKVTDYLASLGDYIQREVQQKLLDRFTAVKRLEKAAIGTNEIDASMSAYKWSRLTSNLAGVMEYLMKHGQIAYKNGSIEMQDGTKGLVDILKPVVDSGKLRLWEGYVAAFRANRLLAEGKEKNFGKQFNEQTGEWEWDKARAQKEIDALLDLAKDHPEFEQVRQDYVAFQKSVLDFATKAGLIDPAKRALWERSDYVPFYRIVDALDNPKGIKGPNQRRGFSGQTAGIRKLKGGPQQVAILENIFRNIEQMVDASFKNIAMNRITDLAEDNTDLLVKIPYKAVPFKTSYEETVDALEKAGVDISALTKPELEEVVTFWRMRAPEGKDIVSVMHQGKPVYYRVKDKPLLRSILALGPERHSWWMRMLMAPKHALTSLVTLDPAFMAANTIRDSFSAWVISDSPIKPGWDSMRGFAKSLNNDPTKLSIMVNGGGTGHYNNTKETEVRKAFLRMTREERTGFLNSIIDSPMKLARLYKDIGRASENANRIAIAESASKRGASPAEAAFQALDIMDFGLRGDSKALNFFLDTVPFMNARIQGLYRLGRGLMNDPKRVATHGAMIVGATLALLASNWDDDRYWDLPDWDRDMYYHLWIGGRHVRIPKPFEVGQIFSTMPERMFQYVAKDGDGNLFKKRMLSMIGDTFALYPIPQAFKPLAERAANKNLLTGGKIISQGDEYKSPEEQYNSFTSALSREIADAAPDNAPEWLRSPKTLDFLIRGYTGTLGMYAMDVADAIVRPVAGYPDRPANKVGDYWLAKRFIPEGDLRDSKFVNEFYNLNQEVSEIMAKAKALRESGDLMEAAKFTEENRGKMSYEPVLNSTAKALSAIRRRERDIYANPRGMSPEARREELARLEEQKNRLAKQTVTRAPGRPVPIYNPFK